MLLIFFNVNINLRVKADIEVTHRFCFIPKFPTAFSKRFFKCLCDVPIDRNYFFYISKIDSQGF